MNSLFQTKSTPPLAIGLGLALALLQLGCDGASSSGSDGPSAEGAAFLLTAEPADATGIVECRSALEESEEPQDVVLVARVGGLSQPTWDPERAVFMVADLSLEVEEDHGDTPPGHDADNCPFCKKKKQDELSGLAMVELVDGDNKTPNVGAQQLLGLKEGQTVVIQGRAELDKLGTLLVRSPGIYVRSGSDE